MAQKKSLLFLVICLLNFCNLYAQENGSLINSTVKQIDSIVITIDSRENSSELLSEGEITHEGENIGGFSNYYLRDNKTKKLFRIRYHESIKLSKSISFYYDKDKVVFVSVKIEHWNRFGKVKLIYSAKYYFQNDKLLIAFGEDKNYSTADDILKIGQTLSDKYYSDLKEDEELFKH